MSSASLRMRAPAPAAIAILAIAFTVGACSKGEPESGQTRPNTPVQVAKPVESSASAQETNEALRERLARQEAASKMFDKPEAAKAPPPKPEAPRLDTPKVEAPRSAPPRSEAHKPEAPKPDAPKAEAPKAEPPKAEPAKIEPPPAARVEAAAPKPAAPSTAARLLTRVDPDFPREAVKAGVGDGSVKARLTLDAAGAVTHVDIVEATPRRIFDRAVMSALSQWKYSEGAAGRQVDVEVGFKR
jgi:protein TonB